MKRRTRVDALDASKKLASTVGLTGTVNMPSIFAKCYRFKFYGGRARIKVFLFSKNACGNYRPVAKQFFFGRVRNGSEKTIQ